MPIFIQAQNHDLLSKVKWYGSDGSALNNKIVRNAEAATFALNTSFSTPTYGVENHNVKGLKMSKLRFMSKSRELVDLMQVLLMIYYG